MKIKKEKVSYIKLQACFWSWLTIKGRNMKVIPKMFGDRNSVGKLQEVRMHSYLLCDFLTCKEILFLERVDSK